MTPQDTMRTVIRRYFEEVWNAGELDVLDALIAPDYVNHSPGLPDMPSGPAGLKPIARAMREAFPDLHYEIEDIIVDGDRVCVRTTLTGTHRGDFFGIPASGRSVRVSQIQIERIVDGRIVEHWRTTEDARLLRQIGVLA
jgi:steroid delta-isomerase-like uncharacterized protein